MLNHERATAGLAGFPTSLQVANDAKTRRLAGLAELRSTHSMAVQVPGMLGHPGFKVFLQEIAKLRDLAISRFMSVEPEAATLLAHRERAAALDAILDLVQHHEKIAADLAVRIEHEEKALS